MARSLKTDIPGPDWRVDLDTLEKAGRGIFAGDSAARPPAVDRATPLGVDFARPMGVDLARPLGVDLARPLGVDLARPLVVDVGFGRGEFLMTLAEKEDGTDFLGVEVSYKRVVKMARRLARTQLTNVRLCEARAQEAVARGLADASVRTFWVNFPDPWPKKRHAARRLLQPAFVRDLARALEPGGLLQVATDHVAYAEWIDRVLSAEPQLRNALGAAWCAEVEGRPRTGYELEWRAEGRPLHFFTYTRCAT